MPEPRAAVDDPHQLLELPDYRLLHAVLDDVSDVDVPDTREHVLDAIARHFGWGSTTFFTGPSLQSSFEDQSPALRGVASRMGSAFVDHFWAYDVFNLPRSRARVLARGAASLQELDLPGEDAVRYYLDQFLGRHGVRSEVLLRVRTRDGLESNLGILGTGPGDFSRRDVAVCRVLADQLGRVLRFAGPMADPLAGLTRREREVARLVARGLRNAEVAEELFVSVDTVKKHLTSVFNSTGCRSRSGLVRLLAGDDDRRSSTFVQ